MLSSNQLHNVTSITKHLRSVSIQHSLALHMIPQCDNEHTPDSAVMADLLQHKDAVTLLDILELVGDQNHTLLT